MKKKILTCLVMLVCIVTLAVGVHATEVYEEISTPAQLYALMQANDATTLGKNYKLTADIDMSGYTAAQQSPIGDGTDGAFAGSFDGDGHFITGINISTTTKRTGLFGWVSGATIENLTVSGEITSTLDGVGGIVGCAGLEAGKTTTIRNCVNYCTVTCTRTGDTARVGGIAGVCSANNKKNVTIVVENCINYGTISGHKHIGGILGRIDDVGTTATGSASVTGCANFGTVITTTQNVNADGIGGIVGTVLPRNSTYTVANCYNSGAVTGPYRVGGVVGSVATYASTTGKVDIKDCVNVGDIELTYVSGSEGALGGILGEIFNNGSGAVTIENCFVSGTLTSSRTDKGANTGAILGRSADHKGTLTYLNNGNCYDADMQFVTAGTGTANKIGGVTVTDLADVDAYPTTFNANDTFLFGEDGPILAAAHTHVLKLNETTKKSVCAICEEELLTVTVKDNAYWLNLATADDLLLLMANSKAGNADALSYNYILTQNIDLKNHPAQYPIGQPEEKASDPKNKVHFTGKFDGNNKTISGILLENNLNGLGLFATVGGGTTGGDEVAVIKNLTVEGTFSGNRFVGAVAGLVFGNAEITNCATTDKTTVAASGQTAGGVVGAVVYNVTAYDDYTYTATVRNCVNNGTVNSTSATSRIGGVVGQVSMHTRTGCLATIDGCINYGKITGGVEVGGISGRLEGVNSFVEIKNCLNVGAVEAVNRVGGIVAYAYTSTSGQMNVSVKDCVNIAAISVTDGYTREKAVQAEAAGIVSIANGTSIANCINAGAINGKTFGRVGGIVSYAGGTTEVKNCLNMANLTGGTETSAIVGYIKATKCDILTCTYMEGITGDPDSNAVTSVTATAAKNVLMTWCIYHGPKADAEDITKSTHTFGTDNKCIVCGVEPHTAHASAVFVEDEEVRIDATCKADGTKFLFCEKCYVAKTETIPKAHLFEWNLTDLDFGCRTCDEDFEQNVSVEEAKNLTTIYVSDDGVAGNNGTDADHPLESFATAMDVAAALGNAYKHEMTIKLVGNVTLEFRKYSDLNTHTLNFEEAKHDYPITITSADVNNKGTLRFSNDAYYYFLYGDTTFKDMQFGAVAGRIGTKSNESSASNIFARGFKLVMGEGLVMLSNSEDITLSKTNAGIIGLGATVKIPDVKLYVFGGFQLNGFYDGDAGKNADAARNANNNLTILSGKYWTIAGANRGSGMNTYPATSGLNKTVTITLGAIETGYLVPLSSDAINARANTVVNIHYTDKYTAAYDFRSIFTDTGSKGLGGVFNRFYYAEAVGSGVGDFSLGMKLGTSAVDLDVNMYYATAMQGEKVITGYTNKHNAYAVDAHQTGDIMSFPEWCVNYGVNGDKQHAFDTNGMCTFCGVEECTGNDHYIVWNLTGEVATAKCIAGCGATYSSADYDGIYVSDNGSDFAGGLSADTPLGNYETAVAIAAKFGKDVKIYLVGKVSLASRSENHEVNPYTTAYEESPHTNTITVTSASDKDGQLYFTKKTYRYFLYGPTTFEHVKIGSEAKGTYIFARGFKIVMGEGLTMVDIDGKTKTSKVNSGITGLGATVLTSDIKLYVYGGFLADVATEKVEVTGENGEITQVAKLKALSVGLYEGANPYSYDADITILSGEYWTVAALNRGFPGTATIADATTEEMRALDTTMRDTTVTMRLSNVTTYYVCATTSDSVDFENCTVTLHYMGRVDAGIVYRFAMQTESAGTNGNKAEHFFYKDFAGSKIGDFGVGSKNVVATTNMYYATALANDPCILGYMEKDVRQGVSYNQTGEMLPFPEWCVKYGVYGDQKHDFVNGVCSFCDLKECSGSNHYVVWDTATGSGSCIACNDGTCDVTFDISAYDAIYVSDTGKVGATGKKGDPLNSFGLAMDLAAKAGKDFIVYLDGTVTPRVRQIDTTYNTFTNSFEESEHTNTITITSANTSKKGTLHFTDACRRYFMYGPTTFKNIKISCDVTNGIYLFARGHKLVMDTGIVMVDVKGKTVSEKLDADISGLGATVETSDVKMYLYGGYYAEDLGKDSEKVGLHEGADPETYNADITVKSGTYWTIGGMNRGFDTTQTMDGVTVKMTLQNVTAYVVCPTTTDPAAFKNVDAEVHYKGKVNTAITYRFSYSSDSASADGGTNTVDHFFYKGYNGSVVGDFGVGAKLVKANVNMYYATALQDNGVILGYQTKDQRYAAAYQQTSEILPFPQWCVKYGGGHTLGDDNICDFCETLVCTTHANSEWVVTAQADCTNPGHEVRRCTTCLTVLEERDTAIVADAHATAWDYSDPTKAVYKCTLCGTTLAEKTYADYTAATALYVSSNAAAGGTGLASDSPINDFATAMELAAKSSNDVTIYILDIAVLADNGPVSDYNDYVEPVHRNNITITSASGVSGVLRFSNANAGSLMTMLYNLSGPGYTKFENIEISSWGAVARMNIAARHNKLIFGESVTADWHRGDHSSRASSDLIIVGGCYGANSCGATCGSDCSALGTDMELHSGNLGAIVGGGYLSGNCCQYDAATGTKPGEIKLTLGDVSIRRDLTAGNYGDSSRPAHTGDIVITIEGNVSVGGSFMFGAMGKYYVLDSEGKKMKDSEGNDITACYTAQDVTIIIKDGSLINGSFQGVSTAMPVHTLGQSATNETVFDRVNTVTVYTDPNCPKAMTVYEHVRDALESVDPSLATDASGNLRYSFKWMEAYCETNNGQHSNSGTGITADKNLAATCLSEGLQAYQCLDCGKTYYESIPALGHKFTDASGNPIPKTSIAASCIAPEMTKQDCQTCGVSIYEVAVDASGNASTPLDGTLYAHHSDPEKTGSCQLCGKDLTAICAARPGGHSFGASTPITSGCATGTRRVCGDCGYAEVTITSTGNGHNYGKYTVTKEPTATEAGVKTRICKGCGKVDTALINASGDAINAGALATDASGNLVGFDIESSKLSRVEKAAVNALLQENAYGSEVKVSYETDGESVTGITYNIPVPAEYTEYKNVMVVVKDEDGNLHFVDFAVEKGYIVFKF